MAEPSGPISRGDVERYHARALELADEARRIIVPALERGFSVQTKPDASLVTDIDQAVERRMRELIAGWSPTTASSARSIRRRGPTARFSGSWIPSTGPRSSFTGSRCSAPCWPCTTAGCRWSASSITRR